MKLFITILLSASLMMLLACEGAEGPMGPAGPQGEQGPEGSPGETGATIIHLTGIIIDSNYNGTDMEITSSFIEENDVVQLYVSLDASFWGWQLVPSMQLANGVIWVYDPAQSFRSWDYWVKIIKSN